MGNIKMLLHREILCIIIIFLHNVCGMDDAGADMEMDMESMMGDTGGGSQGGSGKAAVVLSQIEQTTRALQQIGVILSE